MIRLKILMLFFSLLCIFSCEKMSSSYEEYVKDGETIYVSRVNGVVVSPGKNRIKIAWDLGADPRVTRAKIFWNNGLDSIEKVIDRSTGLKTVDIMLNNMLEGAYSFDIYTYDDQGHKSVKVTVSGNVYGEAYQSQLKNRILKDVLLTGGVATINWYSETVIAIAEVTYTDHSNTLRTIDIPATENRSMLPDYKSRTGFKFITKYLPEAAAIDYFYADSYVVRSSVVEDVSSKYLKNYSQPFTRDLYDGTRWGTLKDWITSASVKNQGATTKLYGGYDNFNNTSVPAFDPGFFGLQKVSADPVVLNGKVYQTFSLPAGKYEFSWSLGAEAGNTNTGTDPRFIVVANGDILPDLAAINTAVSAKSFVGVTSAAAPFTLTATTQISMGVMVNFPASTATQAIRSAGFKLLDVTD